MRKRRLKILLMVLAAPIVLLCVFLLFERIRGQISLAHFKHALTAKGETLDVHKLIAPPVADADNGASEVLRLKTHLLDGNVIPNNYPPNMKLVAPGHAMVGFREVSWIGDKVTNTWDELALDLMTNQIVMAQIRRTFQKPAFDCKVDYSGGFEMPLPQLVTAKSLCQWFGASFQYSLQKEQNKEAFDNLLAGLTVPRLLENDHIVISELVRIAISTINLRYTWETLQADVWTDEQLALIQAAWERNTFASNMVRSLELERAISSIYPELFRKSNEETYKYMFPSFMPFLTGDEDSDTSHWWQHEFFRKQIYCRVWRFAWLDQDEMFYLKGMQKLIEDNRTGAEKASGTVEDNWLGLPIAKAPRQNLYNACRYGMSAQSIATLSQATLRSARAETDRSMVLCAIALKRYSVRHGKRAVELNALVPEFLTSVPIDYMDGKPMKYRLNAGGTWLLYSVGDDGRDDGGDPSPAKPDQTYRWIWRGKDVVWPLVASPEEIETWRKEAAKD